MEKRERGRGEVQAISQQNKEQVNRLDLTWCSHWVSLDVLDAGSWRRIGIYGEHTLPSHHIPTCLCSVSCSLRVFISCFLIWHCSRASWSVRWSCLIYTVQEMAVDDPTPCKTHPDAHAHTPYLAAATALLSSSQSALLVSCTLPPATPAGCE